MLDTPLPFGHFDDHKFSQLPGTFNDSFRFRSGVCFSPRSGLAFIQSSGYRSAWATMEKIRRHFSCSAPSAGQWGATGFGNLHSSFSIYLRPVSNKIPTIRLSRCGYRVLILDTIGLP